ncbi:MAG: hypothetical protein AVDCRST_MAG59-504 [uncultured Thermomicrobiales bacterium]|uniref:Uncharacterized protein n=1 Tax=uncultured Thermomicrobiales bacterium TaxID=1645740 RepID=A0A6J4U0W5_9BACT|nr:MAG: hypothetical protein AVDCRST_MAG59-504 [uncultured Thermomicrobiales bacterium]
MDGRQGSGGPSDLERELREAEEAQAEAEAAAQRAATARAEADEARRRAREEQETQRRVWAQGIVDSYDADLGAAESAIRDASEHFAEAAATDLPAAVAAYLAWVEASHRHYALQARVASVAPVLDLEATPGERLSPPPFSQALDAALDRRGAAISARILDETAAQLAAQLDAGGGAGASAGSDAVPTRIPISR